MSELFFVFVKLWRDFLGTIHDRDRLQGKMRERERAREDWRQTIKKTNRIENTTNKKNDQKQKQNIHSMIHYLDIVLIKFVFGNTSKCVPFVQSVHGLFFGVDMRDCIFPWKTATFLEISRKEGCLDFLLCFLCVFGLVASLCFMLCYATLNVEVLFFV